MKMQALTKILSAWAALGVALTAVSCFGIQEENYPDLSPIIITAQSDTINAQLGVELHYTGISIESEGDVTCEWSYGEPKSNTTVEQHQFATRTVLETTSPTIDYTFTKLGSYILRLKVDNGESIVYKFFRLNVNSGFDEGVAILDNDPEGNASIAFIKTLTAEEKARGDQEVFHLAPVTGLRNGVALYMCNASLSNLGDQAGFAVATADADGTMYLIQPKTFELVISSGMRPEFGTACREMGGEYARVHDMGSYCISEDGRVFRFDLLLGYITEITGFPTALERVTGALNRSSATSASTIYPVFFNKDWLCVRSSVSAGVKRITQEGYEIVNVACARTSNLYPVYAILRSKADPSAYRIQRTTFSSGGTTTWQVVDGEVFHTDFRTTDLKMDMQSKIVNTKASSDVYYTYGNAIYRWGLGTSPGIRPAISLPQGEQIRDIATNFMGKAAAASTSLDVGEDLLYVATYNPGRSGDRKGSLYVYRFSDDSLVAAYEGICHDPASVVYKYRIN